MVSCHKFRRVYNDFLKSLKIASGGFHLVDVVVVGF